MDFNEINVQLSKKTSNYLNNHAKSLGLSKSSYLSLLINVAEHSNKDHVDLKVVIELTKRLGINITDINNWHSSINMSFLKFVSDNQYLIDMVEPNGLNEKLNIELVNEWVNSDENKNFYGYNGKSVKLDNFTKILRKIRKLKNM